RSSSDLIDKVRELGSSDLKTRKEVQAAIQAKKDDYMPVLLGMLHPKFDSDEYTRIGILRVLAANAPMTEVGSRMLAYVAVFDPYPEVRREACVTIRTLGDDNAIRELMRFCQAEDMALKKAIAVALHEIDDKRLLASIIRAIPAPSVTANQGEPTGLDEPKYNLPIGPGGAKLPVWLPQQEVSGVATDIDSPAATLLKLIAKKDLGNMQYSWLNWFREKIGDISQSERDAYKEKRSLRGRMGSPPGGGETYP
ncbi:MAG TPA: HEAT repeat domain-containing protein, partial [Planctomycetota bacterium]|nr:HEAT repeat domain-containing protein [Planctomycetota bacterium]